MFRCLAFAAADLLIGGMRGAAKHRVYRALEHGTSQKRLWGQVVVHRSSLIRGGAALNSRDLIETARGLAEEPSAGAREGGAPSHEERPRQPTQAELRRAVSTAYYAVFHCLAGVAANVLIGTSRSPAWHQVYRALEHGRARNACLHKQAMKRFPPEIQDFADVFVDLQKARHQADYAPEGQYDEQGVLKTIDMAGNAIARFEQVDVRNRLEFAAHVLFPQRPS